MHNDDAALLRLGSCAQFVALVVLLIKLHRVECLIVLVKLSHRFGTHLHIGAQLLYVVVHFSKCCRHCFLMSREILCQFLVTVCQVFDVSPGSVRLSTFYPVLNRLIGRESGVADISVVSEEKGSEIEAHVTVSDLLRPYDLVQVQSTQNCLTWLESLESLLVCMHKYKIE